MPEPLETIEGLFAAINSGEVDEAAALMSPGITWVRPPDVPISGTLSGREKVAKMWRAFGEQLESFRVEPTRIRELGEGHLVHVTFTGTSADGGSFEFAGAQTFRIGDDGLIAEVREFKTLPEAEADLG